MNRQQRRAQARLQAKTMQKIDGKDAKEQHPLMTMVSGLAIRVFGLDKRVQRFTTRAQKADWRSSALLKILHEKDIISYADVAKAANEVQQEELDQEIQMEVEKFGLEDCPEEMPAEKGHHAIVTVELFKDGEKLDGETIKAMVQLGQYDLFPELDDAVVGMKVGETKDFDLEIMSQTDKAQVELIDLKRRREPDAKDEETQVSET